MNEKNDNFPKYPKIQSIYKRDMSKKNKPFIIGKFSCPEFEYLQHNEWEFTEKIDGTNVRVLWDGENFKFGGRTDNAQMPIPLLECLGLMFDKAAFKAVFRGSGVTIYGEGFGGKIQNGGNYNKTETFAVFDIKIGDWWIQRKDLENLCDDLCLEFVPVVGHGTLHDAIRLITDGLQSCWGGEAEGVIIKPLHGIQVRNGSRIITKVKGKDFDKKLRMKDF